ncbi:hypothetical protein Cni_G05098 [Canna indica]|uniref:Trichome birefringence-like N-terminal domain-containing protein n=1 Tax=Canna indica TaxID=4628 RepID=A0AAQ3JUN1_9LILI|nr:hypothetical protein Cni_G05098 [Canna indica]
MKQLKWVVVASLLIYIAPQHSASMPMAFSISSMPKLPCNMEWTVIQKKVGPLLWVLVISTILVLFIMYSSDGFNQSTLISAAAANNSLTELVQSPSDKEAAADASGLLQQSSTSLPDSNSSLIVIAQGLVDPNASSSPVQLSTGEIEEICDVSQGKWAKEPRGPTYTNLTCPMLRDIKNCGKYGKDQNYLYWRWQPNGCDLPRFEPETFLNIVRGKKMAIIGDSLARDHFESLLCLLSQADIPTNTFRDSIDKFLTWHFPKHNFTLMVLWSGYIVEASPRIVNGTASSSFDLHLDKVSKDWADKLPGADYAILSGGNWFFRKLHLYEGGELIGCVGCWEPNVTRLSAAYAITRAQRTALEFISSCRECEGLVALLRTYTPSHFENGSWFSGGYCNKTRPLDESDVSMDDVAWEIRKMQREELMRVRREKESGVRIRFGVLDITKAMMLRADGHPGEHWSKYEGRVNDCLHWCLPGPVDMWSELLLATLSKNSLL